MSERERELTICWIEASLRELKPENRQVWLDWCIKNYPESKPFAELAVEMAAR